MCGCHSSLDANGPRGGPGRCRIKMLAIRWYMYHSDRGSNTRPLQCESLNNCAGLDNVQVH